MSAYYTEEEIRKMGQDAIQEYNELMNGKFLEIDIASRNAIPDMLSSIQQFKDAKKIPCVFLCREGYTKFRLMANFQRNDMFKETPFQILKTNGLVGEIVDRNTKVKCYSDFYRDEVLIHGNFVIGLDKVKSNEKDKAETASAQEASA